MYMYFSRLALLLALFCFVACGGERSSDIKNLEGVTEEELPPDAQKEIVDNDMDGLFYDDEIIDLEKVSPAFRANVGQLADDYLGIKNALVKGDFLIAQTHAGHMAETLEELRINDMPEGGAPLWEEHIDNIKDQLSDMALATDIESLRSEFSYMSRDMATLVRQFGIAEGELYLQYCPMAFDNTGAYWLSAEQEISNPYFGDKMLRCGSTQATFAANRE